ncbi:MAG TPA: thymidine phosphorylase [Actinomycetota bacterium]|jgi:pyrimidine-nucleoside phosphorylase
MTTWDPRAVVTAKRDGLRVSPGDLERFVLGYTNGEVSDGQAAAFLMASLLQGLDAAETLAMTRAMIGSGDRVAFPSVDRPTVDKHSTGGVADGVTLVFAPVAAALGLAVAKLSGRGLGHTGGTLDKLEAIPGLRTDLSPDELERQVVDVGCAVAAQSATLVPADGALYALRDATATVPSIPLIAASVMSKKLAVSTDLILLDVKAGSGAFMKTVDDALALAEACLELARGEGRRSGVAVTDMSQPLGDAIGNALDVVEAVAILRGEMQGRLRELVVWFAARAVEGLDGTSFEDGKERAERALASGEALERFRMMVAAQGGDPRVVDDPGSVLPQAPVILPLEADRSGTLAAVRAEDVGLASGALGAGRLRKGDPVDPAVGIVLTPKVGDRIETGDVLGEVHARSEDDAREAARRTLAALDVVDDPVPAPPLVYAWLEDRPG